MTTYIKPFTDVLIKKPQESVFNAALHLLASRKEVLAYMGQFRVCDLTTAPSIAIVVGGALGEVTRAGIELLLENASFKELVENHVGKEGDWKNTGVRALLLVALLGLFGYAAQRGLSQTSLSLGGRVCFTGDAFAKSFYLTAVSHGVGYIVRVIYAESTKKMEELRKQKKPINVETVTVPQTFIEALNATSVVMGGYKDEVSVRALFSQNEVIKGFLDAVYLAAGESNFVGCLKFLAQVQPYATFVIASFANEQARAARLKDINVVHVLSATVITQHKLNEGKKEG